MNNKLFFDFISIVEKVLHLIILGMVIFLCFEEVMSAVPDLKYVAFSK